MARSSRYVTSVLLGLALLVSAGHTYGGSRRGEGGSSHGEGGSGHPKGESGHPGGGGRPHKAPAAHAEGEKSQPEADRRDDPTKDRRNKDRNGGPGSHVMKRRQGASNKQTTRPDQHAIDAIDAARHRLRISSTAGREFLASLMAPELDKSRRDAAFDRAVRKARSRLAALADVKHDRFELRDHYGEAHRALFDMPFSNGSRGYERIVQAPVLVRTSSQVHVYWQPGVEKTRLTSRKLRLPPRTELYVIDTDTSGLWLLVAHPASGQLSEFVGWVRGGGVTWIPRAPSSAVVAMILEHRHAR